MTTLENAREFLKDKGASWTYILLNSDLFQDHSKHVLTQVITFLEANEKKTVKSVIEELKGKV